MSPPARAARRVAAALTSAAVVGGLTVPLLASPVGAVQETATRRLDGADRYGTAAAIAADAFPAGAESVVLATGEGFADALAANGLAGALDAPILLTRRDALPEATGSALDSLDPDTVYVMGGTAAVSDAVEDALGDRAVERVEGADRYETAAAAGAAIAGAGDGNLLTPDDGIGTTSDGVTAVLANGTTFPDAVSSGPMAFAGRLPVLLTEVDDVPEATSGAIDELGIEHVLIVGGTAVVSDDVQAALEASDVTTERLSGPDRWGTNVAINDHAADELDFGGATAYLSTGTSYADALTGGPAAGRVTAPLVLTAPTTLPGPARQYLVDNAGAIDELVALGGTAAISDRTFGAAAGAAQVGDVRAYAVTPSERAALPMSANALSDDGARTFTVTGLERSGAYVITVVDEESVDAAAGTFWYWAPSDEASTSIESVNGTPVGAAGGTETVQEAATATDDGTLEFVVDAAAPDRIVPVVFSDEDGSGTLTVRGGQAQEPFGLGGLTVWAPAEAETGQYDDVGARLVSREENTFVAAGATFVYGPEDRFRSSGRAISLDELEGLLTSGDRVDIDYHRDAQSSFDVIVDTIPDSTMPVASLPSASNPSLVQVTWTGSSQPDAVYTVHRDDGDGTFGGDEPVVSATGPSTSRQFVESATGPVRYLVVPEGGTSGEPDTRSNANEAITYLSNEVVPGRALVGLTDGTTVSHNAGLGVLNAGDQWMLSFSRGVTVAPRATITVRKGSGAPLTFTNGDTSTWTVDGSTVTIELGAAADEAPDMHYAMDLVVTGLTGISGGGDPVTVDELGDTSLDDNGPELMADSTTCDAGETTCTLAFNEPVRATAEDTSRYSMPRLGQALTGATLGTDGRTVTVTFAAALAEDDRISPDGPLAAVTDDDGQASTQDPFDFVR